MSDHPAMNYVAVGVSLLTAALGLAGWSFDKFETRDHAREEKAAIEKRLERIEAKLDALLMRGK